MSQAIVRSCLLLIFICCGGISCQPKREKPKAELPERAQVQIIEGEALELKSPNWLLGAGGVERSFGAGLAAPGQTTTDEQGRHILSPLGGAKALTLAGRTLENTHLYLVLTLREGLSGLISGGTNNYHDYLQVQCDAAGHLRFTHENVQDKLQKFYYQSEQTRPGKRILLEFHPTANQRAKVIINGQEIAQISSLQTLNYLAAGYRGQGSVCELGELRMYEKLSENEANDVALLLKSYWGLPGGLELNKEDLQQARAAQYLHEATPVIQSEELRVQLASRKLSAASGGSRIWVGASEQSEPCGPDALCPSEITVLTSKTWRLRDFSKNAAALVHFSFTVKDLLESELLSSHGSYVLLYREISSSPWKRLAVSNPTDQGWVHFKEIEAKTGEYTLAIENGMNVKATESRLLVNGKNELPLRIQPGQPFEMTIKNPIPGQQVSVVDASSQLVWYQGPAESLKLMHRLYRQRVTKLLVRYERKTGWLGKTEEIALVLDEKSPLLYPGLLAQIIAKHPLDPALTTEHFVPQASWPKDKGLLNTDYPAFRTAESVHAPQIPGIRPSYHHLVMPSLALSQDPKKLESLGSYPRHPGGDLNRSLRISGFVIPQQRGEHLFSVALNRPARLTVGKESAHSTKAETLQLRINVTQLEPLAFELLIAASADAAQLESEFLWQIPGSQELSRVPASVLFHAVDEKRERALAQVTGNFSHRYTDVSRQLKDREMAPLLAGENPEALKALPVWGDTYLNGEKRAGDEKLAKMIFAQIRDRMRAFRTRKLALGRPDVFIGNIRGDDLAAFLSIQPFLFAAENHPVHQVEALEIRSEIAAYLLSTIVGRSFFNEIAWGANDCYGAEHNFAGAIWPCVKFIDSPYAWDTACNLFDNQFRYCPGAAEGLYADGTIDFHNVNGRQMHLSGYGSDWVMRIGIGQFANSPWAMTPEQFHRLSKYILSYEWFLYRDTFSFLINGRHTRHKVPERVASHVVRGLAQQLMARPAGFFREEDKIALEKLVKRVEDEELNTIQGNRFFYKNLAMVHRRKDYFIESKMMSPLIAGNETFAGKVPWNMGFGDCFTAILRHTGEYAELHRNTHNAYLHFVHRGKEVPNDLALWHLSARPGLTQLDSEVLSNDRYRSGTGTYAGGVSDGELGSMGSSWNAKYTKHHKFNVFTPDGMASLTTGITATTGDPKIIQPGCSYRTNLNQCLWTGPVKITNQEGKEIIIPAGAKDQQIKLPLDQRYLVEHDGIVYLLIPTGSERAPGQAGEMELMLSTRTPLTPLPGFTPTPEQQDIIKASQLDQNRRAKVFHLSINHGTAPQLGQAAYFICVRPQLEKVKEFLKNPPLQIQQNSPEIQALVDLRDGVTHAFFRSPGTLKNVQTGEHLLAVDQASVLMWRPETRSLTVQDPLTGSVHEPQKLLSNLNVSLGQGLKNLRREQKINMELPGKGQPDDRLHGEPITKKID